MRTWARGGLEGEAEWHACLDFALVFGEERACGWKCSEQIVWERAVEDGRRISDHMCVVFSCRLAAVPAAARRSAAAHVKAWGAKAKATFLAVLDEGRANDQGGTASAERLAVAAELLAAAKEKAEAEYVKERERRAEQREGVCAKQLAGLWQERLHASLRV